MYYVIYKKYLIKKNTILDTDSLELFMKRMYSKCP